MAADQFCIRACKPGPKAPQMCEHIYDLQGYGTFLLMVVQALKSVVSCAWNIPGDYSAGFTSCKSESGM